MESDEEEVTGADSHGNAQHERLGRRDSSDGITAGTTPTSEIDQSPFHGTGSKKSAYYNAASEKSLSHEEAKLFYQRHQLEQSYQSPDCSPRLPRAKTFSVNNDHDGGLSRTASTASIRSTQRGLPKKRYQQSLDQDESRLGGERAHLGITPQKIAKTSAEELHSDKEDLEVPTQTSGIPPELSDICANIKQVLDIRHEYIKLSLQGVNDNPKDHPDWKIYPPPPNPTWDENKNRPRGQTLGTSVPSNTKQVPEESDGLTDGKVSSSPILPASPTLKRRKPGHDIGEDFDMAELLPLPTNDESTTFALDSGSVYQIYSASDPEVTRNPLVKVPTLRDFYRDMDSIQTISSDGPTKSFAYRQLDIIEGKFHLYYLVNSYQETADSKKVPHRDFYNVRKVDTHVHHSACMNQKHLLRFIKSKMKKSPNEIVMFRDNKELTLQQVFDSIDLTAYDLSIDTLDMHAHSDSFHRFDKFNLKYNPIGESRLREIFLKTDNFINGRYLAEITKEVISDLEASKYQFVEWRVSIYGRSIDEWDKLAAWVIDNKLVSHNVRWLVQIPRLYSLYKANGQVNNYEQILTNIFQPLFEVTQDPSSHDKLHVFLQRVVGFDSVDDESKVEVRLYRKYPPPREWNTKQNPPYTYWIYHLFANMTSLNQWRQMRGFNTFVLRPHCGEAGDVDHIAAAVLCCHSISHGLVLRKVPLLQYIFYLDQIGIAMSPLSNNALFLTYDRNPFQKYFKRGLNVSLSTDDPLQFAFTKEPLIEEYSVAAQIYRLSAVDMCELAHHSVIQSGFEHKLKQRWLGPEYHLAGVDGNNVAKSNVPNIRERFRYETLKHELDMLDQYAAALGPSKAPVHLHTTDSTSLHPTSDGKGPTPLKTTDPNTPNVNLTKQPTKMPARVSSTIGSPTQANANYWTTITPSPPRIFPGVVHERTRRGSLRKGNSSEEETSGMGQGENSKRLQYEQQGTNVQDSVLEE